MGKAWGNALGGWRRQPRGPGGRFGHKFGSFKRANQLGRMAAYRYTYRNGAPRGAKAGARTAGKYGLAAVNHLRKQGFFINPEIGLSGAALSTGYRKAIAPKWNASIAIKVSVQRSDGGPIEAMKDQALKKVFGGGELYNLAKYGVASTPISDTVITRQGTTLRMKSGAKAGNAERKVPKKRAAQDKAAKERKAYRAQRRTEEARNRQAREFGHPTVQTKKSKGGGYYRETTLSNGTKIVNRGQWDDFSKKHNKAERHLEHNRIRAKQSTRKKSNKKGVASTITA